jgi:hypothetical protein
MHFVAQEIHNISIVSVDCQHQLPMDKDEGSLQSTCDVPKDIWSGFTPAEPCGCSSDSGPPGETSGDV